MKRRFPEVALESEGSMPGSPEKSSTCYGTQIFCQHQLGAAAFVQVIDIIKGPTNEI
jgi:hypothetical protein